MISTDTIPVIFPEVWRHITLLQDCMLPSNFYSAGVGVGAAVGAGGPPTQPASASPPTTPPIPSIRLIIPNTVLTP